MVCRPQHSPDHRQRGRGPGRPGAGQGHRRDRPRHALRLSHRDGPGGRGGKDRHGPQRRRQRRDRPAAPGPRFGPGRSDRHPAGAGHFDPTPAGRAAHRHRGLLSPGEHPPRGGQLQPRHEICPQPDPAGDPARDEGLKPRLCFDLVRQPGPPAGGPGAAARHGRERHLRGLGGGRQGLHPGRFPGGPAPPHCRPRGEAAAGQGRALPGLGGAHRPDHRAGHRGDPLGQPEPAGGPVRLAGV